MCSTYGHEPEAHCDWRRRILMTHHWSTQITWAMHRTWTHWWRASERCSLESPTWAPFQWPPSFYLLYLVAHLATLGSSIVTSTFAASLDKHQWQCFGKVRLGHFFKFRNNYFFCTAGTCRCGAMSDSNAVVSERLRVLNVNNLRVIDGSIMPQVINANSWIATAMIAEYGAQMVRDDNRI